MVNNYSEIHMPIRSVRLFLSSTFQDMQEEREELIGRVFPQLRERCEARGVNWGEVDLRWGVSREEAEEGLALPICLAEIDDCRPFFVAILGERYGWVPDTIAPEVVERFSWLSQLSGRSVTELEIRHGALNHSPNTALFYFRDPRWLQRLPSTVDRTKFESARSEDQRLLAKLKAEILASGHPVKVYHDPKELGSMVRDDLTQLLDRLLPDTPADCAERDAAAQQAFINRLSAGHVGREEELHQLNSHVQGRHGPAELVVTGDPGSGKSSLLAKWLMLRSGSSKGVPRPELSLWQRLFRWDMRAGEDVAVYHFAGASVDSIGIPMIVRRLTGELGRLTDVRRATPLDLVGLATEFAGALALACAKRRVILVLDGLDQVDQRGQGLDLAWLPDPLPVGVRIVASAGPGPTLDELVRRGWRSLTLGQVGTLGRAAFVTAYLRLNHHKTLDRSECGAVAAVEAGASPLFLRTFLEELVASARGIEDLPHLIRRYSAATSPIDLLDMVLERLESKFGRDRTGLVAETLSLLWASRYGLSDREIEELLALSPGGLLPGAIWIPLRQALRPFTGFWSGLVNLPALGLRQAAEGRYLSKPGSQVSAHQRLAAYFAHRPMSERVVEELPWQLAASGEWRALADLLSDPLFLEIAWPRHRYELASYWQAVQTQTPVRMADTLIRLEDSPSRAAMAAAQLLADLGHRAEALRIAWKHADSSGGLAALDLAASLAVESGDLGLARTLSARQAEEAGSVSDVDARLAALARLAAIARRLAHVARVAGDPGADETAEAHDRAALVHLDMAERLAESVAAGARLADLLGQRVQLLETRGMRSEALVQCDRRAKLYRQLGDLAGLQNTFAHRGRLLAGLRKSSRALVALREAESLARRLHDPAALQACLGDLADVLITRQRLDDALIAIVEREKLCRDTLNDRCGLALTTLQKASLFGSVMKQSAVGLDLVKHAEELATKGFCAEALARASAVRAAILAAGLLPEF